MFFFKLGKILPSTDSVSNCTNSQIYHCNFFYNLIYENQKFDIIAGNVPLKNHYLIHQPLYVVLRSCRWVQTAKHPNNVQLQSWTANEKQNNVLQYSLYTNILLATSSQIVLKGDLLLKQSSSLMMKYLHLSSPGSTL